MSVSLVPSKNSRRLTDIDVRFDSIDIRELPIIYTLISLIKSSFHNLLKRVAYKCIGRAKSRSCLVLSALILLSWS
jgi:hypothetical protein